MVASDHYNAKIENRARTQSETKDRCAAICHSPATVGVRVQVADHAMAHADHSAELVTASTTSMSLQPSSAAGTSLHRSPTPIGSLLRERMFFLATYFLRLAEHPERELSSALRCTAWVVMSQNLPEPWQQGGCCDVLEQQAWRSEHGCTIR
jgi:2,4-dienoyl-CoA reductase-like NADH-dependent reductase (Old Yellow Enzyme family)